MSEQEVTSILDYANNCPYDRPVHPKHQPVRYYFVELAKRYTAFPMLCKRCGHRQGSHTPEHAETSTRARISAWCHVCEGKCQFDEYDRYIMLSFGLPVAEHERGALDYDWGKWTDGR